MARFSRSTIRNDLKTYQNNIRTQLDTTTKHHPGQTNINIDNYPRPHHPRSRRTRSSSLTTNIPLAIIAIFLPPLPVFIRTGFSAHFIINLILTVIIWFPGVIHAWYVLWRHGNQRFGNAKWAGRTKAVGTYDDDGSISVVGEKTPLTSSDIDYTTGEKHAGPNHGNLTVPSAEHAPAPASVPVPIAQTLPYGNMHGYYGPLPAEQSPFEQPHFERSAGQETVDAPAYDSKEVQVDKTGSGSGRDELLPLRKI